MSKNDFLKAAALYQGKALAHGDEDQYEKVEWVCKRQHRFTASLFNVKTGIWCIKCRKEEEKEEAATAVREQAIWYGGECLTKTPFYLSSNIKLICSEGHTWTTYAKKVLEGGWCNKCNRVYQNGIILENYKEWAENSGLKILTDSIAGDFKNTKLDWQCSKGHTWSSTIPNMKVIKGCVECHKAETKKTFLQEMRKIALSKGGKCLSTDYLNNYTHLEFRCKKGHTFFANANNIKTGYWCAYCSGNAKIDIELLRELAIKKGGQLISSEYINTDSSLTWKCKKGHIFHLCGRVVKNKNKWCPHCKAGKDVVIVPGGEKFAYDIDDMHKLAKTKGGLCVSKIYKGSSVKLKWECSEGHQWLATPAKIRYGSWCKICRYEENAIARRLPLNDIVEIVADKEGKILSTEKSYELSHPLVKLKCKEGHVWETNIKYIKYGSWCPDCMYDTMSLNTRFPFSHYQKLVGRKGGKILTAEEDYQNSRGKLTIKCKKGHVFEKIAGELNGGGWCVECG